MRRELRALADPRAAGFAARFFKAGRGEYGEGDRFLGIRVPVLRRLAREYCDLTLPRVLLLLRSCWHEERLLALLILVLRYRAGNERLRERIFRGYLAHTRFINNWDLVDASAPHVVGAHLEADDIALLERLARSRSLWERRIAVVATFSLIRRGNVAPTLRIARLLLRDPHDLIHKAVGWMLREAHKRDPDTTLAFLERHRARLPRTTLR